MHTRHYVSFDFACQRLGGQQQLHLSRLEIALRFFLFMFLVEKKPFLFLYGLVRPATYPFCLFIRNPNRRSGATGFVLLLVTVSFHPLNRGPSSGTLDSDAFWMHPSAVDALNLASLLAPLLFTIPSSAEELGLHL